VAVDLSRVIAAPDEPKVALYDVDRTRLAFAARGHSPLRFAGTPLTPAAASKLLRVQATISER
jgi:hypothetical protein